MGPSLPSPKPVEGNRGPASELHFNGEGDPARDQLIRLAAAADLRCHLAGDIGNHGPSDDSPAGALEPANAPRDGRDHLCHANDAQRLVRSHRLADHSSRRKYPRFQRRRGVRVLQTLVPLAPRRGARGAAPDDGANIRTKSLDDKIAAGTGNRSRPQGDRQLGIVFDSFAAAFARRLGIKGEKTRQRAALTVSDLIDAFLEGHAETKLKAKTQAHYAGVFGRVRDAYGNAKAEALTRRDVAALHHLMAATPYQANRMLAAVSSLYAWGERHGHLPEGLSNPVRGIARFREHGRERFLTSDELARLGDALRLAETDGLPWDTDGASKHLSKEENRRTLLDPFAAAAVRLLILTGARLREILHAKWDQVDTARDSVPG
jgi:hypothetical protein